jgi:hypothetical protein
MILYDEMIREKVQSLRFGLLVIGCSNAAFWISWIITGFLYSVVMTVVMIISGHMFNFDLFTRSPFSVVFAILFSSSLAYLTFACALTTLMTT